MQPARVETDAALTEIASDVGGVTAALLDAVPPDHRPSAIEMESEPSAGVTTGAWAFATHVSHSMYGGHCPHAGVIVGERPSGTDATLQQTSVVSRRGALGARSTPSIATEKVSESAMTHLAR